MRRCWPRWLMSSALTIITVTGTIMLTKSTLSAWGKRNANMFHATPDEERKFCRFFICLLKTLPVRLIKFSFSCLSWLTNISISIKFLLLIFNFFASHINKYEVSLIDWPHWCPLWHHRSRLIALPVFPSLSLVLVLVGNTTKLLPLAPVHCHALLHLQALVHLQAGPTVTG